MWPYCTQTRTKTIIETPCNDLQHNISSAHVTVLSSSFRLQQVKVVEDCEDGGGLAGREFVHAAPDRQTSPETDTRCSLESCSPPPLIFSTLALQRTSLT